MARLETYTAGVGIDAPGPVNVNLQDPIGPAISRLGGTLADIAAHRQQRQEQKEDFQADNDYRALNLKLGDELNQRVENSPPDGDGLHDSFMADVFRPQRDAFVQGLPPRLREKYQPEFSDDPNRPGATFERWSIDAATKERDKVYSWADQSIKQTTNDLANQIDLNPERYDALLEEGRRKIASSPTTPSYKEKAMLEWENLAQQAKLGQMLRDRPEDVVRELGGDPRNLSPGTYLSMLTDAVIGRESSGDPTQISDKGALGLMQVMPGTARDIAKALHDDNFPTEGDPTDVARYLMNPSVNKRYGQFYLTKQLRDFSRGGRPDVEAALIAYNAGPAVAKKWLENGRDDSVIPAETRAYYKDVLGRMKPTGNTGTVADVKFVWARRQDQGELQGGADDLNRVNPDLRKRVGDAFGAAGVDQVRVLSGWRDPEHNAKVGGAKQSQHIHGNALDIDVSGMPLAKRIELIRSLSANGVTGIGVYANTIHADLGGRRAWGSSHHGDTIPKWAQPVIREHLAGTSKPITATSGRFASLPWATRQEYLAKADGAVARKQSESSTADLLDRTQLEQDMNDELARIETTGQQSPSFDETRVATLFGEGKYAEWAAKRETAQRIFSATQGIDTMPREAMDAHLASFNPDPSSENFLADQRVQAAVLKKITETEALRARHPDEASLRYPEVKEQFDNIQQQMAKGQNPDPAVVQQFVRDMLTKQADLGIAPTARAPVPENWAIRVGQQLSKIPELSGHNAKDVRAAIALQYQQLQQVFGPYADDVIVYALAKYHGLSKTNADVIGAYMTGIAAGRDVFHLNSAQAEDMDQMEQASNPGLFSRIGSWLIGRDNATPSADDAERALRNSQGAEQ